MTCRVCIVRVSKKDVIHEQKTEIEVNYGILISNTSEAQPVPNSNGNGHCSPPLTEPARLKSSPCRSHGHHRDPHTEGQFENSHGLALHKIPVFCDADDPLEVAEC